YADGVPATAIDEQGEKQVNSQRKFALSPTLNPNSLDRPYDARPLKTSGTPRGMSVLVFGPVNLRSSTRLSSLMISSNRTPSCSAAACSQSTFHRSVGWYMFPSQSKEV